ncbi:MAG: MFS transporter [Enterobacterales bacterium]|nr:MFS transporter [Enterobacterales bacterium]
MPVTLLITLFLLLAIALIGYRISGMPKNVWLLFMAQPLALSSASMMVMAGGLLGAEIAPSPQYATIPLTLMILSTAAGVFPAALLMKRYGRRKGTLIGLACAVIGALIAAYSAIKQDFYWLILGAVNLGFSMAFVAQMRFAVIESLAEVKDIPKAISILMIGSMFAAVLGPEMAVLGKEWINSPFGYAGSFIGLAVMIVVSMALVSTLAPIGVAEQKQDLKQRQLSQIIKQPIFVIAVCAGAVAYGVMSYVMTASPLSMHQINHHDLDATKWVIQSHIIAMYLPSLFSAVLIRYFGVSRLMAMGTLVYLVVIVVGLSGQAVMHYWWAMVLLGIGWNFLYTAGTVLLPETYRNSERFKVQATNDFIIFFIQAISSLAAGWILFQWGWDGLIKLVIPAVVLMFLLSIWFLRLRPKNKP